MAGARGGRGHGRHPPADQLPDRGQPRSPRSTQRRGKRQLQRLAGWFGAARAGGPADTQAAQAVHRRRHELATALPGHPGPLCHLDVTVNRKTVGPPAPSPTTPPVADSAVSRAGRAVLGAPRTPRRTPVCATPDLRGWNSNYSIYEFDGQQRGARGGLFVRALFWRRLAVSIILWLS